MMYLCELDMERVGNALITTTYISRVLGHRRIADTARDYLEPHMLSGNWTPEQHFVIRTLTHPPDEVVTEEEMLAYMKSVPSHLRDAVLND